MAAATNTIVDQNHTAHPHLAAGHHSLGADELLVEAAKTRDALQRVLQETRELIAKAKEVSAELSSKATGS